MKFKKVYLLFIVFSVFLLPTKVNALRYCKYRAWNLTSHIIDNDYIVISDDGSGKTLLTRKLVLGGVSSGYTSNVEVEKVKSNTCPRAICPNFSTNIYEASTIARPFCYTFYKSGDENDGSNAVADIGYPGDKGVLVYTNSLLAGDDCYSNVGIFKLLSTAYVYLKIAVPILLVIFATIDIGKAMVSSDEGKMKKAQGNCVKRFGAAIIVFLSFTIVEFIIGIIPSANGSLECLKKFFE